MLIKLIVRNVRRSVKDYLIYFLSVALTAMLFYSFNSLSSQQAFAKTSALKGSISGMMGNIISYLSVVVAVVLAFLVIYANQFLLKRRKKELGIYMTLGMTKTRISFLFLGETSLVGLFALMLGLVLGVFISQCLSLLSIKLFAADISAYQVVFSVSALQKTLLCFAIIFVLVSLFNVRTVASVKLIDLLMAGRKNECLPVNSNILTVLGFTASIALMALSFCLIQNDRIISEKNGLLAVFIAIAAAIVLFFYCSSSALLKAAQKSPKFYLKNLNAFLIRQIGSKIRTNFLSVSVVCGLLVITVCVLSSGISAALTMNENAQFAAPYDMIILADEKVVNQNLYDVAKQKGVPIDAYVKKYVQVPFYDSDLTYEKLFTSSDTKLWDIDKNLPSLKVNVISVSDFNQCMELQHGKTISLKSDEFALNCNYKGTRNIMDDFLMKKGQVTLNGITLQAQQKQCLSDTIYMTSVGNNDRGTLIVADSVTKHLHKAWSALNAVYKRNVKSTEKIDNALTPMGADLNSGYRWQTKSRMYSMYYGAFAIYVFVFIYIGLVFLLISVTLLSLQQLTEAADNLHRYSLLQKLGVGPKQINMTLLKQVLYYFVSPLLLAAVISAFIIKRSIILFESFVNMNISVNSWISLLIILLVYGVYFIATYSTCKKLISEPERALE